MYMSIRLPASCLLILIYCFWSYEMKKRLRTKTSRLSEVVMVAGMFHLITAVVTEYMLNYNHPEAIRFHAIWHILFLISVTMITFLVTYYVLLHVERSTGVEKRTYKWLLLAIFFVSAVGVIVLPMRHVSTAKGAYILGAKVYVLQAAAVADLAILLYLQLRYRTAMSIGKRRVFLSVTLVYAFFCAIQITYPYVLCTDVAVTLVVLGLVMNTENARLYTSYKTGLYNELGCREILQELILLGNPFQAAVYVFVGDEAERDEAMMSVERQLGKRKTKIMCGTLSDNVLVLLPIALFRNAIELPSELPVPTIRDDMLKYHAETMLFYGKEPQQVLDMISEYKKQVEENEVQRDELTGLLRRNALIKKVAYFVKHRWDFAFLMLDMDDFKLVNDRYGHEVGDQVLRRTAHILTSVLRNNDVICRIGGDEFAVALCGMTEEREIRWIAERITGEFRKKQILPDKDHVLQLSVGVKIYRAEDGEPSFRELYVEADNALYRAKNLGKNRVVFADEKDKP